MRVGEGRREEGGERVGRNELQAFIYLFIYFEGCIPPN